MNRFINPVPQYILANGNLAAGGTLHLYASLSSDYVDLFADSDGNQPISNPVELGIRGEVPNVFYEGSVRAVLKDADGNQLFDVDPVQSNSTSSAFDNYNSKINYDKDDIVLGNDGNFYISLVDENQSNDPTTNPSDNAFWSKVILFEEWNAQRKYDQTEFTIFGPVIYYSLTNDNIGNNPASTGDTYWRSISDAINVVYSNTSSGLVAVTAQDALDELKALFDAFPDALLYRGVLDVSTGDASLPALPSNGDLYIIGIGGTITVSVNGLAPVPTVVTVGQEIVRNTAAARWDLIPYSGTAATVSYNNLVSAMSATNVQEAVDELDERVDTAETQLSTIESQISGFGSALNYRGTLDLTTGDAALPIVVDGGDAYIVYVGGTATVSVNGAASAPTAITTGQTLVYNSDLNRWDLLPSADTASSISFDNSSTDFSGSTVQQVLEEVDEDLIRPKSIAADSGVVRRGNITDVTRTGTANVTYTVNEAGFVADDVIRFRKPSEAGSMTIVTASTQVAPDGTADTSSQFADGAAGSVDFVKTATQWELRIY